MSISKFYLQHADVRNAFMQLNLKQFAILMCVITLLALTSCSKQANKVEDIRPVRTIVAKLEDSEILTEFPGEIRPRIESRLAFRVPGKIIARKVEIGSNVKQGQILMQLDTQDLSLAQTQAKAVLVAAESNRNLAQNEYRRYQDLREKNFISQMGLDAKETAFKAAQAAYDQASAGFSNQTHQLDYSTLLSDVEGVVTGLEAEIGQVVGAGTPVIRVAKTSEIEMVVAIPEDKINYISQMKDVKVRLWANPDHFVQANLRELSPVADPVTRTFAAKIALPKTIEGARLGMTAKASFSMKNPSAMVRIPMNALLQNKNLNSVWVVENGSVRLVPIQIGATANEDILVSSGISVGQIVVTAGVNLLKEGQKVSILSEESKAPTNTSTNISGVAK